MKLLSSLLAIATLVSSMSAFAKDDVDYIEQSLSSYAACEGPGYDQQAFATFKNMFLALKAQRQLSKKATLDITALNYGEVTILDLKTKKECTLVTDVYEGRCSFAVCSK